MLSDAAPVFQLSTALPVGDAGALVDLAELRRWGCTGVELELADLLRLPLVSRQHVRTALAEAGLRTVAVLAAGAEAALQPAFDEAAFFGAAFVIAPAPATLAGSAAWAGPATALAAAYGVPLLVQNCPATAADTGAHLGEVLSQGPASWLGAAFDPAGFVAMREHPFLTAWMAPRVKGRLEWVLIADAVYETGARVPLGQGNAEIRELVSALLARSFTGCFSVAPLGRSAAQVRQAIADFQVMLAELDAGSQALL